MSILIAKSAPAIFVISKDTTFRELVTEHLFSHGVIAVGVEDVTEVKGILRELPDATFAIVDDDLPCLAEGKLSAMLQSGELENLSVVIASGGDRRATLIDTLQCVMRFHKSEDIHSVSGAVAKLVHGS